MSNLPKGPGAGDDTDWADALDEWEQKAFGSVHPPPVAPSVAPPAPRAPTVPPAPPLASAPPTLADEADVELEAGVDGTLASAPLDPSILSVASTDHQVTVEVSDDSARPPPPPLPSAPELGDADVVLDALAPPPLPVLPGGGAPAAVRFEERPSSVDAPRLSSVSGALRALASLEPSRDEETLSRMPMPSVRQVDADVALLLEEQAAWLTAEAASCEAATRSRVLLAVSEMKAIVGDHSEASKLAEQARELTPQSALAHGQVRAIARAVDARSGQRVSGEAAALLAEEASVTLPACKQHAALLAAEVLRLGGDQEGALLKVSRVADAGDVRGLALRAAFGLAQGDLDGLAASIGKSETAPIAAGLTTTLRLRGLAVGADGAAASPEGVTDAVRATRLALAANDALGAAQRLSSLRAVPELADGATWLAAALAGTTAEGKDVGLAWLGDLAKGGDKRASRVLAARAVETNDAAAATAALSFGGFSAADEVALTALLPIPATGSHLDDLPPELAALATAVSADPARGPTAARATRVVGSEKARVATLVGRLLAARAPTADVAAALPALHATSAPLAGVLELELALREGAHSRVSDLLQRWTTGPGSQARVTDAPLAAALVAERAGDPSRALAAYREARGLDRSSEVALRAIAALQPSTDLPGELNELADELGATLRGALARLEAVVREDSVDDATRTDLLDRAHQAAPAVPLAAYLAERIALRGGHVDDVLRWIATRAEQPDVDPTDRLISTVREARLLAERDPEGSAARIEAAYRQRPHDLTLRELYERGRPSVASERAAYWEAEARAVTGPSRALINMDVAHAFERAGDATGALRVTAPTGNDPPLLKLARQRAELEAGEAAELADQLLTEAKSTTDATARREAYERLADIDGVGRGDPASALLWRQSIVEEEPNHLPSLRYIENALIGEGRDDELEPVEASIAQALFGSAETDGGERVAHADLAARLRARGPEGDWEATFELAELAARDVAPSVASLRLLHAHARVRKDDELLVRVSQLLLDRATRPVEMAALRLRLGEAAFRQNDLALALSSLERSTSEDPGDLVAFRLLAEVRHAAGDEVGAAEAHEAVARLSLVREHQLDAWYDAARLWLTDEERQDQSVYALEQAAALDLGHEDVFTRLAALYAARGAHGDLASLLERRIGLATDLDERVTLEVERARALLSAGDRAAARVAIEAALADRPDHTTALATFGDLSALDEDWAAAEDAWVRLARLLATPEEQRAIYERLGDLYSEKAVHLERAELAFKEVLKRAPGDVRTLERLVDIHRRQRDVTRAVQVETELLGMATTPAQKRDRTIELARLHEDPGHDDKKAEQVLEAARREFPNDVVVLRALAEFYARHKETPAVNILLDRAAADARRAFAAGRFAPALFEIMQAVFELRGQGGSARIVGGSLRAIEGKPTDVRGAFGPALDERVDELLAPDVLSPGLRDLLSRLGSILDVAAPIDLRALAAQPAGPEARMVQELAGSFASGLHLPAPKIFVSKTVGKTCLPAASEPPSLVVGESLLGATNERAVAFIVMRAMKLVAARASALVRSNSTDLAALIPAWLQAIAPKWTPQGVNPTALAAAVRKIGLSPPPAAGPEVIALALDVAAGLGTRASTLGGLAAAWANRSALLGVGDPNAALEALAWSLGLKDGAPTDPAARVTWIGRTHEAKDLLIFSVSDAYAEARVRVELHD
jgi:tetratricopeptide (TPR) repeat protein